MFGCSRPAAASASAWKRRTSASEASCADRIILSATRRLRLTWPRLVDDAHAAAGDLPQHFVVAEVAQPHRGVAGRRGRGGWDVGGQGGDQFVAVQGGESRQVLVGRTILASAAAVIDLQQDQFARQRRTLRLLPTVEPVLNVRRRPAFQAASKRSHASSMRRCSDSGRGLPSDGDVALTISLHAPRPARWAAGQPRTRSFSAVVVRFRQEPHADHAVVVPRHGPAAVRREGRGQYTGRARAVHHPTCGCVP